MGKHYLSSKTIIMNGVILLLGVVGFWMSDELRIALVTIGGTNLGLRMKTKEPLRYRKK